MSSTNGDSTPLKSAASPTMAMLRVLHHGARRSRNSRARYRGRRPAVQAPDRRARDRAANLRVAAGRVRAPSGSGPHRKFSQLLASPTIASKKMDHRAIRLDGAHQHARRPRRGRCRRAAPERIEARPRARHRRQRALVLSSPRTRRDARRRRSRAQRGLHRRAPDCRDELPEFRQSRKARSDVAIQRSDRRHHGSLHAPWKLRSPAAT